MVRDGKTEDEGGNEGERQTPLSSGWTRFVGVRGILHEEEVGAPSTKSSLGGEAVEEVGGGVGRTCEATPFETD